MAAFGNPLGYGENVPCVVWRLATVDNLISGGDFRNGYLVDATVEPHKDYCGGAPVPISSNRDHSTPPPKLTTGDPMTAWRRCGSSVVVRANGADSGTRMIDLRFTVQDQMPLSCSPHQVPIAVEALIPEGRLTAMTSN